MANDIKRLNYFTGQFLEAQDFKDEQQYHIEMRRGLNRLLYSPGVVENGLEIKKVGDIRISVGAGFAIDALGRELFITAPQETDVTGFDPNTVVYVALSYNEIETDARSADNISGNIRITESPEIKLLKNLPAGDRFGLDIPIATVKLDANKNIESNSLATSERLMANLKVGSKKLGIGITTDPKFALSVAGAVAIGTNFANLAITDNSLNVEGNIIGKNLSLAADNEKRGALFFTSPGLYNHAVYNNNSNVDGEGKWDGIKFNTGAGIHIRTGSPQNYVSSLYIIGGPLVGINTTEPKSHLSVAGGLSVGATYAKTNAAPANGLLVEGKVGIGTTEPKSVLSVGGGIAIGSTYAKTNAAPANGLLVEGKVGIGVTDPGVFQMNVAGTTRIGGVNNYGSETLLSIAPGTVQFDAVNIPGGRLTIKGDSGNVGIGTNDPKSALSVAGGLAVGSTYAKTNAAPANNLLVEGNVGIGTFNPMGQLQIMMPPITGKGKIKSLDNNVIQGASAEFLSNVKVGDLIKVSDEVRQVTEIINDNGLKIDRLFSTFFAEGTSYSIVRSCLMVKDGAVRAATFIASNPMQYRMYPADPIVYQQIFDPYRGGLIAKLANTTNFNDTSYATTKWNGYNIIAFGKGQDDRSGAQIQVPSDYDTVWVRCLGERWIGMKAKFADGTQEDLGFWGGGFHGSNSYCPDGSVSDGVPVSKIPYDNLNYDNPLLSAHQWIPIPAGRAGKLNLTTSSANSEDFWLSGLAFSKNPWRHVAVHPLAFCWENRRFCSPRMYWAGTTWYNWGGDLIFSFETGIRYDFEMPVLPSNRDKLFYLIEHNTNWNGCHISDVTVGGQSVGRFLTTYENPFARHWNSKMYQRYLAVRIPASLVATNKILKINFTANYRVHVRELGTHDLEVPVDF